MSALISVNGATVHHGHVLALDSVTVDLEPGKLHAVIGPNGAGKSTFIKAVMGLLPLSSGEVRVLGEEPHPGQDGVVFVPQRQGVDWSFPATVRDLVMQGATASTPWWRWRTPGAEERVQQALERVSLDDLADRSITDLSGGQQQRAFLARALAQRGQLVFLDEPMAGVDAGASSAIFELFRSLVAEGATLVVVHHGLNDVLEYADNVILLQKRLLAVGPAPEVVRADILANAWGGDSRMLDLILSGGGG